VTPCWCSKPTIAAELGVAERTVQYALERLERAGVIRQVPVAPPGRPDPDEPKNRTGWRIYLGYGNDSVRNGPLPSRFLHIAAPTGFALSVETRPQRLTHRRATDSLIALKRPVFSAFSAAFRPLA
jgi:hypothetical protein